MHVTGPEDNEDCRHAVGPYFLQAIAAEIFPKKGT